MADAAPDSLEPDRRTALGLMAVSRETERRLARFVERLRQWQTIKNLVGPATLPHVWTRHVADSAQLLGHRPEARTWVDLGSGAGFPGLVLAIMLQEQGPPGARVHLVESNGRKCAFLRDVIGDLRCPALVHQARIADVVETLEDVDVVTSRALAPLPDLLKMGKTLFARGASALFLKSSVEVDAIAGDRQLSGWTIMPSQTSPDGRIVMIDAAHAAAGTPLHHQQGSKP